MFGSVTGHGLKQSSFLEVLQSNRNRDETGERQAGEVIIPWRGIGDKMAWYLH